MKHSTAGLLVFLSVSGVAPMAGAPQPTRAAAMPCANAASIRLPDVKISEAVAVPAATTGQIRSPHCRVTGVIGTEIRFRALLPDAWNGKFMMGGGGGYVGTIDNQAARIVDAGFATVGTDTGHQAGLTDASWALDNLERVVNFGHLAVHRTAEVTKGIIRAYYGADASRSYFSGCSNGGRQAMMQAQRYPDDFDGIVAGAPALDFVGLAAQFVKDIQALYPDSANLTAPFTVDTLKAVETQILDKCDALDGVKDGLMEDPRKCTIDVAALTGVTDTQRAALKKVYAETAAKDGRIYPGQPFGGEGDGLGGFATWITGAAAPPTPQGPSLRYAFGTQFFKFFVYGDPSWNYARYDLANARRDGRTAGATLSATSTNLDAFKAKGRKLLMWHGWSDPALTALATVQYYEQVEKRDPQLRDYFRLFMMPGVLHCAGGPGPDTADWPTAIADWVENGKAPDRVVARKLAAGGAASRTRPLCPYPQHAVYSGTGSTDDEKNFVCK